jgi:DNA-binding XRE family transcriptional regulator
MKNSMTPDQYEHARVTLGMSHEKLAQVIGVDRRTPFRWVKGENRRGIREPQARLVRLLVLLRLTVSERKFNEILGELHG